MRRRLRYGLSALAGVALAAGAVATTATAHTANNNVRSFSAALSQVAGSAPSWATSSQAVGTLDSSRQLRVEVALPLRNEQAAAQLAASVSDPNSSNFHRFITPEQFNSRFAPTKASVQKVTNYLKGQGLKVEGATAVNNHFVAATGSASVLGKAFHTTLRTYHYKGQTQFAPSTQLSVPSSLSADVSAVVGLNSAEEARPNYERPTLPNGRPYPTKQNSAGGHSNAMRPGAHASPNTAVNCVDYFGQKKSNPKPLRTNETDLLCGYEPKQVRSAYGAGNDPKANGAGQTIAIVDAFDYGTAAFNDANRFFAGHGVVPLNRGQYTHRAQAASPSDGCAPADWRSEQMLDIEAAHTMAPSANLYYYGAANCQHLFDPVNAIVATKAASIISNSWGYPGEDAGASVIKQANNIFLQAAAEGIGIYVSSGDRSDHVALRDVPGPAADFPSSSPWATAVGGTSLAVNSTGGRFFETGWQTRIDARTTGNWAPFNSADTPNGYGGGAGGGISKLFTEPSWQRNVVPAALSHGHRAVPDVSAIADPYTGMLVGFTDPMTNEYSEAPIGGTSLATPVIAGIVADAQQLQGNSHFGLLTPALYKAYGTSKLYDAHNVSSAEFWGDQLIDGADGLIDNNIKMGTLQATAGWDNTTGVGTPNGTTFLAGIGK